MTRIPGAMTVLRDRARLRAEVAGRTVLVLYDNRGVRAIHAYCPHRGAPLDDAPVLEGLVVCPWHRSLFSLADGTCVGGPSAAPLPVYRCRIDGDDVVVEVEG